MFLICLDYIVNGYQIQRLCICLGQWKSKKIYLRLLINKTLKTVWNVSKSREVCQTSKDILFFREQQIYLTLMFFNLSSYLKGTENFKNSGYALSHIDFL